MIQRNTQIQTVLRYFNFKPVVALVGGRQVGKSALAEHISAQYEGSCKIFDLKTVRDRQVLSVPETLLAKAKGLVILDEVQRYPRVIAALPKILNANKNDARFLLMGGTPANLKQPTLKSIEDKIVIHELPGLSLHEVGTENIQRLWLRGGLPYSFTADSRSESFEWRTSHTQNILGENQQGDGPPIASERMRSFLMLLAKHNGETLDVVDLARSFGVRN